MMDSMSRDPRPGQARVPRPERSDAIGKALAVLRCFVDGQEEWGVRELAAALRQPTSSVHRILKILRREGYLDFDATAQRYRLGLELMRIAAVVTRRPRLDAVAAPVMAALCARLGESIWLAVHEPERGRAIYLHEHAPERLLRVPAPIGRAIPLAEDIAGLVILAAQEEASLPPALARRVAAIRGDTYALEVTPGRDRLLRIAAVIRGTGPQPSGALVLAMPENRFDAGQELALAADVVAAANEIAERQGARILGGASSGSWRDGVEALAQLVKGRIPGVSTAPSLGGGVSNLLALQEEQAAYCITTLAALRSARAGLPPFAKPLPKLRAVAALSDLALHIVAAGNVRCEGIADLAGLRVAAGLPGFASHQLLLDLLRLAGVTPAARRKAGGEVVAYEFAEAARQLMLGNLDVVLGLVDAAEPSVARVLQGHPCRLITPDPVLMERLAAEQPGFHTTTIAPGTYAAQRRAVVTLGVQSVLATHAGRRPAEVASLARLLAEQGSTLGSVRRLPDEAGPLLHEGLRAPCASPAARS